MTALIFNTSPLSHFALAGRLAVLDRLTAAYRRVVPQAVLDELRAGELAHPPLADVRNADWLEVVACDGLAELRAFVTWTPPRLTGQVALVCSMSGSGRQVAATSAGVR